MSGSTGGKREGKGKPRLPFVLTVSLASREKKKKRKETVQKKKRSVTSPSSGGGAPEEVREEKKGEIPISAIAGPAPYPPVTAGVPRKRKQVKKRKDPKNSSVQLLLLVLTGAAERKRKPATSFILPATTQRKEKGIIRCGWPSQGKRKKGQSCSCVRLPDQGKEKKGKREN